MNIAVEQTFESEVKSYWNGRSKDSARGLALLDQCINRTAQHGDWDALARFLTGAMRKGQGNPIKRIIRAAFGDKLAFKVDAKHDAGGKFTKINWPDAAFPLHESNHYGLIRDTVAANAELITNKGQASIERLRGWDDKTLQSELLKQNPVEKKERKVSEESKGKVVKHLVTYTNKLKDDGFDVGEIIALLQKELTAAHISAKV